MKPNVLMIMVDQMRADCLSILDHPIVDTPNLDQLARNGVLFENAYSATPTCVPARAAVLTGRSQTGTGRVGYEDQVPWDYEHTMPGEFARAGYHTQNVGKMHVYPTRNLSGYHNVVLHDGYMHYNRFKHRTRTADSFEETDDYLPWLKERAGSQADLTDFGLDCNASTVARPWTLPEEWHPTNWVTTQSIDFLRRRDPDKPFFLKMSYVRPHPPLDPPQVYYDMYKDLELPEPPVGSWAMQEDVARAGYNPVTGKGIPPKRRMQQAKAAYYALITHIDHQIGRFLMAMQEYGVYDNTVIMFVSDHGELLGDHHLFQKALPYEGSSKIPMLIADPGDVLGLPKNVHRQQVTELRDIMPTLLDVASLAIPSSVEGRSMLRLWEQGDLSQWRDYIHGEHEFGQESYHYITDGQEKYIWFSQTGQEQFFDLKADPQEMTDLSWDQAYQDRIGLRKNQLIEQLKGREEGYVQNGELITGCPARATLEWVKKENK